MRVTSFENIDLILNSHYVYLVLIEFYRALINSQILVTVKMKGGRGQQKIDAANIFRIPSLTRVAAYFTILH